MVFSLQELAAHTGVDGAYPPSKEQPFREKANGIWVDRAITRYGGRGQSDASFNAYSVAHARPFRSYVFVECSNIASE